MGPEQCLLLWAHFHGNFQGHLLGPCSLLTPESFALPAKQDRMWLAFAVLSSYKGRPEEKKENKEMENKP